MCSQSSLLVEEGLEREEIRTLINYITQRNVTY